MKWDGYGDVCRCWSVLRWRNENNLAGEDRSTYTGHCIVAACATLPTTTSINQKMPMAVLRRAMEAALGKAATSSHVKACVVMSSQIWSAKILPHSAWHVLCQHAGERKAQRVLKRAR